MAFGNKFRSEAYVIRDERGDYATRFLVMAQDAFGTSLLDVRMYSGCTMQTYIVLRTTEAEAVKLMKEFIERADKDGLRVTKDSPTYAELLGNSEFENSQEMSRHPSMVAAARQENVKKNALNKKLKI